jgi:CheY-like chemotaxis protein
MPHDTQTWSALVVDDESENLAIASADLALHGITPYVAQTGKQALALMNVVRPTFILLDLDMPMVTGWEVVQEIRNHARWANTPVIALTNLAFSDNPLGCFEEKLTQGGFDGFIGKPFEVGELVSQVQAILDKQNVRA